MSDEIKSKPSPLKRVFFILKFLEIRLRFVLILVLTALVVGYWDYIQNYYERWQRDHGTASTTAGDAAHQNEFEYYCAMHPFVVRDTPGKCPICGMDLIQRKKGAAETLPEGVLARVQVSPERIMQAGVQIEPATYHLLSRTIRSYGVVEVAETRLADVIARFPGRVEELMVNATGLPIQKGQPLVRIYSPQYLAGALDYQRAIANQRQVDGTSIADANAKDRAKRMVESARRRLSLAGFTDAQLESIANGEAQPDAITLFSPVTGTVMKKNVVAGQNVEEGTAIYSIADLSTLWIQVQVTESDIAGIKLAMPVEVSSVAWPGEIFYGTVDFFYPEVDPATRSLKVRVAVSNTDGKLRPGMYVNAVMRSPLGAYGPTSAVATTANAKTSVEPAHNATMVLPTKTQELANAYLAKLADGATYYTCTMHGEVVSDKAGECPLCGMTLVARKKGEIAGMTTAALNVSLPTQTADDAAKYLGSLPPNASYFTCEMHPEVVSDKPGDCPKCKMKLIAKQKPEVEANATPQAGSLERWAEGYACAMHPDELNDKPGVCTVCGCGMKLEKMRIERVLAVPESAVIDTGTRKMLYVEFAPGVYDARQVSTGPLTEGYFPILDGVTIGQRVVARGSFLIDAEARLNPAVSTAAPPAKPAEKPVAAGSGA